MASKPKPEPILGRINCARCSRWRHLIDFPARYYKTKTGKIWRRENVCEVCRRAGWNRHYDSLSYEEKKRRWTVANRARQKKIETVNEAKALRHEVTGKLNGRLVSIVPFRMWLIKKLKQYESLEELSRRTGVNHSQLTKYIQGYEWNESLTCDPKPVLTLPITVVDKALQKEGTDHLRSIGYES
jgi:hypothetical protein